MKKFLLNVAAFSLLIIIILAASLFFIPNNRVKEHMLSAVLEKHVILDKVASPRIVFVGGSSVAYSLNSRQIQDSLNIPVVNAGLNARLGMKFYLEDIKAYIRQGDIVVVAPEYMQYFTDVFYGNADLVSTIFDINRGSADVIPASQWVRLMKFIPFYSAAKILSLVRSPEPIPKNDPYGRYAFNEKGDAYLHWDLPGKKIKLAPIPKESDAVNPDAIASIESLRSFVISKGAKMILLPPVFRYTSFQRQEMIIDKIYQTLKDNDLPIVATPERYCLPDSLFYDSDYHLGRAGVKIRSNLVIEDLKKAIIQEPLLTDIKAKQ